MKLYASVVAALVVALVAALAVVAAPVTTSPAAAEAVAGGGASVEQQRIPLGGGVTAADAGSIDSGVVETEPFGVVGVAWDDGGQEVGLAVQVRVRGADGWSAWTALGAADAGPDADTADARSATGNAATEPLIVGTADAVEVRAADADEQLPSGLEAVLLRSDVTAADVQAAAAVPPSPGSNAVRPAILPRAAWQPDESLEPCEPDMGSTMQMAFVHHTDSINDYAATQVPSMLRAIHAYHTTTNGWCDIAYNFLVDRFGRVWEGRAGSIDTDVIGGHTKGFNSVSFAVSLIGSFSQVQPTAAMLATTQQVLGWKLSQYGRDPRANVTVVSKGSDRYPAGTPVTLNVISGHRDTGVTACPGNYVYEQLVGMRLAAGWWADQAGLSPFGNLELARAGNDAIEVQGWAMDREGPDASYVWLAIGGLGMPLGTTGTRADVASIYPGYGQQHGFSASIPVDPGSYTVCVTAINVGWGQNNLLGCQQVDVGGVPFGHLDEVSSIPGGMFISGWALDPNTTQSTYVWITVNGRGFPLGTPFSRPDVAAVYSGYGPSHGFWANIPLGPGTHLVCAIAINTGRGPNNPIGCSFVTVR